MKSVYVVIHRNDDKEHCEAFKRYNKAKECVEAIVKIHREDHILLTKRETKRSLVYHNDMLGVEVTLVKAKVRT